KPFKLLLSGGIDAEYFAEHSELSGPATRKRAGLELRYVPELTSHTTTLTVTGLYAETETAADLQPLTGIEQGRQTARLWSGALALTHRLSPRYTGDASYAFSEASARGITSVTQQARVGFGAEVTRLDTVTGHYTFGVIDSGGITTTSHAVTAG